MEKVSNNSRNKLGGICFSAAEDNAVNRINQVARGVYDCYVPAKSVVTGIDL